MPRSFIPALAVCCGLAVPIAMPAQSPSRASDFERASGEAGTIAPASERRPVTTAAPPHASPLVITPLAASVGDVLGPAAGGPEAQAASPDAGLPLDGFSYLDRIRARPDVVPNENGGPVEGPFASSFSAGFGGWFGEGFSAGFSVAGQRGQSNSFLVDGLDNNESWTRGAALEPPAEAIREVSMLAASTRAEFGGAAGATVNVETRSGSNQFHGRLFELLETSDVNARNFFDGSSKPAAHQNRFGASAGGAIQRNQWFLFGAADVVRDLEGLTIISSVPTAAQKSGDFGSTLIYDPLTMPWGQWALRQPFPDNQIPADRIPEAARKLAALYPDPNLPGDVNNFRFTPAGAQNITRLNLRSDRIISAASTLFVRASYEGQDQRSPGALPAAASLAIPGGFAGSDLTQGADGDNTSSRAWSAMISHTLAIRPSLAHQFRAGITGISLRADPDDLGLNAASALGIPGLASDGIPSIEPTGLASLGAAGPAPLHLGMSTYQVDDAITWTTSRHAIKAGFQMIRRHADGDAGEWTDRGTYFFTPDFTSLPGTGGTGDSFASLLLGFPSEVRRDVQFAPFHLRAWEWSGFVQDQIRVGRRLTIEAGLRYSLTPPLTEANNRMVNFNFDPSNPALSQFAANSDDHYAGLSYNKHAIAPRIGFALALSGRRSSILRGAFSQNVDTGTFLTEGSLARNPPYASRLDLINGTFITGPNIASGLPAPTALTSLDPASLNRANAAIYGIASSHFTPYSNQWDLFLQQKIARSLMLEVGGTASMGIHLYSAHDANQPVPWPAPYITPRHLYEPYESRLDYLGLGGGSTYYGGQIRARGQIAPGFTVVMGYTFSKSIDDSSAPDSSTVSRPDEPQDISIPRENRSASSFDVTQRAVLEAYYDLPLRGDRAMRGPLSPILQNWRIATVVTIQSGFPLTPELAVNTLSNGGFQLPDRLGDGSLPAAQRSYLQWFNTSLSPSDPNRAFQVPALYEYGSSGFNIVRGPGLTNVDGQLSRAFPLHRGSRLETRVEALNLLNHTNFALPDRMLGVAAAGVISHTSAPSRQIRLAASLEW